jgi:hypothetical protein
MTLKKGTTLFSLILLVLVSLNALAPIPVRADVYAYAVDTKVNLYLVDITTATKTLIGSTGVTFLLEGLALSPAGILFATDTNGNLYSINKTSGAATLIGSTGLGNIEGLDFNGNTLIGTNFSSTPKVYSINTTNAAPTLIVTAASSTGVVRTAAVLDSNTLLISTDGPPNDTLSKLDLTTGTVTGIGTLAVNGSTFAAMDFLADGKLYGLDNDGSVWLIDPNTAAVTLHGNTGGDFWLDMTTASVPAPATILLLGSGLLGLMVSGIKRKLKG